LRKSFAQLKLKELDPALESVKEALVLKAGSKEALDLKKVIYIFLWLIHNLKLNITTP
jgi:hypothetical protein